VSEQELRDGLQDAVWDEPPLNFDPDSFMARAEQLTRRRRALASVGVATALIIATVAAVPAFVAANRNQVDTAAGQFPTTAAPSTSATPADIPWPPSDIRRKNYEWSTLQPRMLEMWPELTWHLQHVAPAVTNIGEWKPNLEHSPYAKDNLVTDVLVGPVTYTDDAGPAILDVTLAGAGAWEPSPVTMCRKNWPTDGKCDLVRQPDGTVVVTVEQRPIMGGKPYGGVRAAYHYRSDGSVVAMTSRATSSPNEPMGGDRIPLTFGQLTELVTDQAVRIDR
jgi:hypothetical protein